MNRAGFSLLASLLALASVSAKAETQTRAITLKVQEEAGQVALELIAHSETAQQISFTIELTGASNARHASTTSIAAGERQVLSRLQTDTGQGWCAIVHVTEENGAQYTLDAGDCA